MFADQGQITWRYSFESNLLIEEEEEEDGEVLAVFCVH